MNCFMLTSAVTALMMKVGQGKVLMKGIFVIFLFGQFFSPLSSVAALSL